MHREYIERIVSEVRSGATNGVYFEKEVYSLFANPLAERFRSGVWVNIGEPIDVRARLAAAYAIDADLINNRALGGKGLPGKGIINANQLNEVREGEVTVAVEVIWRDLRPRPIYAESR